MLSVCRYTIPLNVVLLSVILLNIISVSVLALNAVFPFEIPLNVVGLNVLLLMSWRQRNQSNSYHKFKPPQKIKNPSKDTVVRFWNGSMSRRPLKKANDEGDARKVSRHLGYPNLTHPLKVVRQWKKNVNLPQLLRQF